MIEGERLNSFTVSFHPTTGHLLLLGPSVSLIYFFIIIKNKKHTHTHTHTSSFFFSLQMTKPPNTFLFTHFTTLHHSICTNFHDIFHTKFYCSQSHILSCHMLLSDNSFPQSALLTVMFYAMSKSLIHMSMLAGKYYFLNLSLPTCSHSSDKRILP